MARDLACSVPQAEAGCAPLPDRRLSFLHEAATRQPVLVLLLPASGQRAATGSSCLTRAESCCSRRRTPVWTRSAAGYAAAAKQHKQREDRRRSSVVLWSASRSAAWAAASADVEFATLTQIGITFDEQSGCHLYDVMASQPHLIS